MKENHFSPRLRATRDYGMFSERDLNRDVKRTKLLELSMRKYGFDPGMPIRCIRQDDGRLRITHGHRRFYVARLTGNPVWFIEVEQDIPLFESEASLQPWGIEDYATARKRSGDGDAAEALDFCKRTGIAVSTGLAICGGESASNTAQTKRMKQGTFQVRPSEHMRRIEQAVLLILGMGITWINKSQAVNALSKMLYVPEFNLPFFLKKVEAHPELLEKQPGLQAYLELYERIYNFGVPQKNRRPLAFEANRIARQRKDTFGGRQPALG